MILVKFLENRIFSLKARSLRLSVVLWCGEFKAVTHGQTSRERGRVQPRAGGREAETYPAFGGALAHPPELQLS